MCKNKAARSATFLKLEIYIRIFWQAQIGFFQIFVNLFSDHEPHADTVFTANAQMSVISIFSTATSIIH